MKKNRRLLIQGAAAGAPVRISNPSEPVPTYEGVAYSGGIFYPRQAPQGVVADLTGLQINRQDLVNTREHNPEHVAGQTTSIRNNHRTLTCSGALTGTDQTILESVRRAKAIGAQFPWELSVDLEFNTDDVTWLREGQTATVNGQTITGPVPIVRRSVLRRIDFVTKGGDRHATARITAAGGETMTFDEWLAALKLVKADLGEEALTALKAEYDAKMSADLSEEDSGEDASLTASAGTPTLSLGDIEKQSKAMAKRMRQELQAAAASARTHIEGVRKICAKYDNPTFEVQGKRVSLEAHALENDWDLNQVELEAMRESRPKAPGGRMVTFEASADALVASRLLPLFGGEMESRLPYRMQLEAAGGMPAWLFDDINAERKQRVLEAASRLQGLSSMDFARACIEADGRHIGGGTRQVLEAAASTGSLSNIISTTSKTAILISFRRHGDTTEEWCEVDDGKDFLESDVVGLKQMGGSLDPLEDGTAKHTHLSDKGEAIKIDRYANQHDIDETTLINDQLGEIMKLLAGPGGWGSKAANLRPDLVYSLILDNPVMSDGVAFFHADHRNLQSGALSATTLGTAINLLQLAYEGDSNNPALLDVKPTHLILPPAISFTGTGLTADENIAQITANLEFGLKQVLGGGLKRVAEPRLQLGMRHKKTKAALAGSATQWYLASSDAPPVLVRYLTATGRSPQIRTTPLTKGQWGVNVDIKFDIGACLNRFQTLVRS